MSTYATSLTRRARDILITYNDGTWQTTIQPVDKVEAAFAAVNTRAARESHRRADISERAGHAEVARHLRRRAMSIDPAPRVQEPPHRIAAE